MNKSSIIKGILTFLLFAVLGVLATKAIRSQNQKVTVKDDSHSTMRWEHSDNGDRFNMEIRGKAEFNDEYTDITALSEGGYMRIEEDRHGQSRRYEVRRDANGELKRIYSVNGENRTLDQASREWIGKLILDAVRQSAIDADKRVQSILRKHGVKGVLDEIQLVSGDYAQRHYFQALIKFGNLNQSDLQNVLQLAARQISSDYEQAELLIGIASELIGKESAGPAFFDAANTIKSDYERKRVLTTILKQGTPTREILVAVAKSTAGISSDYEKASVLKEVSGSYLDDQELRALYFQSLNAIDSDYEHRGVLSALLKKSKLSSEVLAAMLESAMHISSDYEKATFLLEASKAYGDDARLRSLFLKAVDSINSEYERGRVLSVLLKNKQIT
ncbi:MAG TPA: hypothetical protein VGN90_11205 [Pyrinomonadaceae bacterium]|jgi:hypothetical protein|nr:hypothetical protein [Pyrinomonadaceae bacterium]